MKLNQVKSIAEDLWLIEAAQKYSGLEVGTRMTIVRLEDDKLLLISPIVISGKLKDEIETLGSVAYIVSPNLFHHTHIESCCSAFPDAQLYVAKGLPRKRPDLKGYNIIPDKIPSEWAVSLDMVYFDGFRVAEFGGAQDLNEAVFFHRPTNTLIVTDIVFHFTENSSFLTRLVARALGIYRKVGSSPYDKRAVKDHKIMREARDKLLAWPFDRIILTHGDIVESEAKVKFELAYRWLSTPR